MAREKICVWGASITWGAWDREKGGRVSRLRLFCDAISGGPRVYNLGVSGATTQDLLKRFEVEASARKSSIIIFSIGINDSSYIQKGTNTFPIPQFEANLRELISLARKFTDKIVFLGINNIDDSKTKPAPWGRNAFYTMANVKEYSTKIQEVCEDENVFFLDLFDVVELADLTDGMHPSAEGHEKIFQAVKDFLMEQELI